VELNDQDKLLAQVREIYGRVAYTHKTHEKQADICDRKHRNQRKLLVVLTVISSGTFLASLLPTVVGQQVSALIVSFIALVVTGMNLSIKNFKHGERMQQHRDTAARLWNVRESYLSLITDIQSGACTMDAGRQRRDQLQKQCFTVLQDAPRTTPEAYAAAQDGLKNREDLTFSEREIDVMLPERLRTNQGGNHEDQ